MDLEKIAFAAIPVVLGVIVAGFLLANIPQLSLAQSGYTGAQ